MSSLLSWKKKKKHYEQENAWVKLQSLIPDTAGDPDLSIFDYITDVHS